MKTIKKDCKSRWQFHRHMVKTPTRLPTWPTLTHLKIWLSSCNQSQRWERRRTRSQRREERMKFLKTTSEISTRALLKTALKILARMQLLEQQKGLRSRIKRLEPLQGTTQVSYIHSGAHHRRLSLCRDCPNTNRLSRAPRWLLLLPLRKNYKRNLLWQRTDKLRARHLEAYSQSLVYLEMISAEKGHPYRAKHKLRRPNPRHWL